MAKKKPRNIASEQPTAQPPSPPTIADFAQTAKRVQEQWFHKLTTDIQQQFREKLSEMGEADRAARLPGELRDWQQNVLQKYKHPTLYDQGDGTVSPDAARDIVMEDRRHQSTHGKPLTEPEALAKTEHYLHECGVWISQQWRLHAFAEAAIRQADRLKVPDARLPIVDFLNHCMRRKDSTLIDAAIEAADRIARLQAALPTANAEQPITGESAAAQLRDIRDRIIDLRKERMTDQDGLYDRLRLHQSDVMRVYRAAVRSRLLPDERIPAIPDDLHDESLVYHWRKLAISLHQEFPDRLGDLDSFYRLQSMPEWLNHAEKMVSLVIDLLNPQSVDLQKVEEKKKAEGKKLYHSGHAENEGTWSNPPLPLSDLARCIDRNTDYRAAKGFFADTGLIQKTREGWIVRLDNINPAIRDRITKKMNSRTDTPRT